MVEEEVERPLFDGLVITLSVRNKEQRVSIYFWEKLCEDRKKKKKKKPGGGGVRF